MKKNLLLLVVSTSLFLITALSVIRWFAPQLLGISPSLQMVRVAKEVPPFFENVFRPEDIASPRFIIEDPYLSRAKPLYPDLMSTGPHDMLGFRNRSIPNVADIITIGDSQTYGNNVPVEENWPNQLKELLNTKSPMLYNMAVGGWGAAEYLEIFSKAMFLRPRIVIVAFYAGNDPLDSFVKVYGSKRWERLRPDPELSANDVPDTTFPAPESEWWKVKFNDGVEIVFTPKLRQASNMDHPAVKAGYAIMAKVAEEIAGSVEIDHIMGKQPVTVAFTIIPTKELVYAKKVESHGYVEKRYSELVHDEKKNLLALAERLRNTPGVIYIDLLESLQQAALKDEKLYPETINGHPLEKGYRVIAEAIESKISQMVPPKPDGGIIINLPDKSPQVLLIRKEKRWNFASEDVFLKNGWKYELLRETDMRDIANIPFGGVIETVNPEWHPNYARQN